MILMPAGRGDDCCREIMRTGIHRMPGYQLETRKQNIRGSIERGIGVIEPRTAGIIRVRRHISVIVITGLNMGDRRLILRHCLTTGPEGEHQ